MLAQIQSREKFFFTLGDSRNMEFDPKQNLFKNLPLLERVTAPSCAWKKPRS